MIFYDKAAKAYEYVWSKIRTGSKSADALYNAGLLRQALGHNKEASAHYQEYAKKFRERKDAPDVAFNIGVVYEQAATFYLRVSKETSDGKVSSQALMNAGVMFEKAKQPEKAADIYLDIAEKYGDKNPELGEKAILKLMDEVDRYIPQPMRPLDKPFLMPIEEYYTLQCLGASFVCTISCYYTGDKLKIYKLIAHIVYGVYG